MKRTALALLTLGAAALVALTLSPTGCQHARPVSSRLRPRAVPIGAVFELDPATRLLTIRGSGLVREASLLLSLDGVVMALPAADLRTESRVDGSFVLSVSLPLGLEATTLRIELTHAGNELAIAARIDTPTPMPHSLRLRLELAELGSVFAAGLGDVIDLGRKESAFVTLQGNAALPMLGMVADAPLTLERFAFPDANGERMAVAIESPSLALEETAATTRLQLSLGTATEVLSSMFRAHAQKALTVRGKVQGASEGAAVYAVDEHGRAQARALLDAGGGFELAVPKSVTQFFAANREQVGSQHVAVSTSPVVTFEPGVAWPLLLSLERSGTCIVQVFDGLTQTPLTARLIVRGVGDTRDPWFGPDYRASGAGPVADVRDGSAELELPAGTYKVQATHGPFYSIDEVVLKVRSNARVDAVLRPRRVIPGLGLISSDLHVHARPSYDSPVQPEDRVLSLVAAGIEFAVPTEHNVVGDYSAALELTGQANRLRSVPGVEVTTSAPKQGHFGVFPVMPGSAVPPHRATTLASIFAFVRRDPSRVLIVHHPFLGGGMGYFDQVDDLAPERGEFGRQRLDFDAIELLNGYETLDAKKTEETLASWLGLLGAGHRAVGVGSSDSHRILYGWAGYPRTLVRLQESGSVDLRRFEPAHFVAALKAGRAQASTGPVIELSVQGERSGATVKASDKKVRVHVIVRAAPWIDVTRVELIADGHVAASFALTPTALHLGAESGSDDQIFARSVRFERELELPATQYVLAVARGTQSLDWVLPATALPPIAITNPVWIE